MGRILGLLLGGVICQWPASCYKCLTLQGQCALAEATLWKFFCQKPCCIIVFGKNWAIEGGIHKNVHSMHQITEMSDKFCSFKKCKKINSSYFEGTKNKKVILTRYLFSFRKCIKVMWQRIWCDYDKTSGRLNKIDNMYIQRKFLRKRILSENLWNLDITPFS